MLAELRLVVALRAVAASDVADLVAQDASELGLVVGERHQPAGDIDIAARQRERVDHVAVEQREGERLGARSEAALTRLPVLVT